MILDIHLYTSTPVRANYLHYTGLTGQMKPGPILFDNLKTGTLFHLSGGGTEYRSYGLYRAALFADYFSNILIGDFQLDHIDLLPLYFCDHDLLWLVH